MGDQNDWVIEVNDDLKRMADDSMEIEKQRWMKCCIYKVPNNVRDLNRKAYMPQTVSFGPYHHGEGHLKTMEEHKRRALLHFLKRSNKPLELYVSSLGEVLQDLKDSYDSLDRAWHENTKRFLQLMILDGCFLLEILRTGTGYVNDHADYDPIFGKHGKLHLMPYIRRDMLMLENQLPMLVLERLLAVEDLHAQKGEEFVNVLIVKFCSSNVINKMGKCFHVLDVYRKSLLWGNTPKQKDQKIRGVSNGGIIRSADELHEAGIRFKKSKTTSLKDISFDGGVLRLPAIVVDDVTEPLFLNLIAYERFHVGLGNEVTSYIFFMDNLIDNVRDVSLLHSRSIIQNAIGSDKAVANLFNSLSKDVTLDPDSSLDKVHSEVTKYSTKRLSQWRARLVHSLVRTYFRTRWAILPVTAATFIFTLTIVQTIYTVLSYHNRK